MCLGLRRVEHAIGRFQTLFIICLGIHTGGGFGEVHAPMLDETLDPLVAWGVYHHDGIKLVASTRLNQQWNGIHHGHLRVCFLVSAKRLVREPVHLGMDNLVETLSCVMIAEHLLPESGTVKLPTLSEDSGAKRLHNSREPRRAWCNSIPGEHVGIDYGDATLP